MGTKRELLFSLLIAIDALVALGMVSSVYRKEWYTAAAFAIFGTWSVYVTTLAAR